MSVKFIKNSVSLKDETTQEFVPIGMVAAGSSESLSEVNKYINNAVSTAKSDINKSVASGKVDINSAVKTAKSDIDKKVTDTKDSIPADYSELSNNIKTIYNKYFTEYNLASVFEFSYVNNSVVDPDPAAGGAYIPIAGKSCFDKSSYFKVTSTSFNLTITNMSNGDKITFYLCYYDKDLNYLGSSIGKDGTKDAPYEGTASFTFTDDNETKYIKVVFYDFTTSSTKIPRFASYTGLAPVKFFTPAEYNIYLESKMNHLDFAKNTILVKQPLFSSGDEGMRGLSIIDNYPVIADHKYSVTVKSSETMVVSSGIAMVGFACASNIKYNSNAKYSAGDLHTKITFEFIAVKTDYGKVYFDIQAGNFKYSDGATITATIRDVTSSEDCDSVALKSDIDKRKIKDSSSGNEYKMIVKDGHVYLDKIIESTSSDSNVEIPSNINAAIIMNKLLTSDEDFTIGGNSTIQVGDIIILSNPGEESAEELEGYLIYIDTSMNEPIIVNKEDKNVIRATDIMKGIHLSTGIQIVVKRI